MTPLVHVLTVTGAKAADLAHELYTKARAAKKGADELNALEDLTRQLDEVDTPNLSARVDGRVEIPSGPTRESVLESLDNLPDGIGDNFIVRQNSNGSFSAVRIDTEATLPLRVSEDAALFSVIPSNASPTDLAQINRLNGLEAERAIASRFPGSDTNVFVDTANNGRRFIDVLTPEGLAIESKVGRTSLTTEIKQQILKDVEILANTSIMHVSALRYEFSVSPITGLIGPTPNLRAFLEGHGIDIVINEVIR